MESKMVKWLSAFVVLVMVVMVVPQAASAESSVSGTFPDRTFSVTRSSPGGPRTDALAVDIVPTHMGEWWVTADTVSGSAVIVEVWRNDAGVLSMESSSKLRDAGQESAKTVLMGGQIYTAIITPSGKGGTSVLHEHFSSLYQGSVVWMRQFGTKAEDMPSGIAVYDSCIYLAGSTNGGLLHDAFPGQKWYGGVDAFVHKCDLNGNEIWTRQFGTAEEDHGGDVAVDSSGVYVVGSTAGVFPGQTGGGGAFIRKYDHDGNEIWTRQFSDIIWGCMASSVAVCADGIFVSGDCIQSTSFVLKYSHNGILMMVDWIPTYHLLNIATYLTGVYLAGFQYGTVYLCRNDLYGNEVWNRSFGTGTTAGTACYGISVDASGVYLAGATLGALPDQVSHGYADAYVCKYDLDGNEIWMHQYGTPRHDDAGRIAVGPSGVYVCGVLDLNMGYIRKYDFNGNEAWTCELGIDQWAFDLCAAADSSGVYFTGWGDDVPGQMNAGIHDVIVGKLLP